MSSWKYKEEKNLVKESELTDSNFEVYNRDNEIELLDWKLKF